MKNFRRYLALILMLLVTITAPALARNVMDFELKAKKFVLDNGLTVLYVPRCDVPVFTGYILAKVGSVNEVPGLTGSSHLLEHMMFKGTKQFGTLDYSQEVEKLSRIDELSRQMKAEQAKLRTAYGNGDASRVECLRAEIAEIELQLKPIAVSNELWSIYQRYGGENLNASTGCDSTKYYVQLPSNYFELWAKLESDRLANAVFREFYSERDVVREERRLRVDNEPAGMLQEQFRAALFIGSSYAEPIIGWACDLETITREELRKSFETYYAPNNLVMVLVGDLSEDQVNEVVKKYFGGLQARPEPPARFAEAFPPCGERRVKVVSDSKPGFCIGYPGPVPGSSDSYALAVLADILSNGRTSRFQRQIVDKNIAATVYAGQNEYAYATAFVIDGTPQGKHTTADVERAVYAELDKLAKQAPEEWEFERAFNQYQCYFGQLTSSSLALAAQLARAEAFAGGWANFDDRQKYMDVTGADIERVIKCYLTADRRTVAESVSQEASNDKRQ